LNGKGIEDIAELEFTGRNVLAQEFATGWPVLHQAHYAKGSLFVLTVPENVNIKIIADKQTPRISNVLTGEEIVGKDAQDDRIWDREGKAVKTFDVTIEPHSYLVFQGD
jgi:hypothetical protein